MKALLSKVKLTDAQKSAFRSRDKARKSVRNRAAYWDSPVVCSDGERRLTKQEVHAINTKFNDEAREIAGRAAWSSIDERKDDWCWDESCGCTKSEEWMTLALDYNADAEEKDEKPKRGRRLSSDLWITTIPKEPKRWMQMIAPYQNWDDPHWNPTRCRVFQMPIPVLHTEKLLENGGFIACVLNWNWREYSVDDLVCTVSCQTFKCCMHTSGSLAPGLPRPFWFPVHLDSSPTSVRRSPETREFEIPTC